MSDTKFQEFLDKLTHTQGSAWDALVANEVVNGWQDLAWSIALLVAAIGIAFVGRSLWRTRNDMDDMMGIAVVLWCVAGVALLAAYACLTAGVGHLSNPTGYAIENLRPR